MDVQQLGGIKKITIVRQNNMGQILIKMSRKWKINRKRK
jgi:hypothetical protein